MRRAGLRGFKGASRAQPAASLHLTVTRVARLEHRALRALRAGRRAGACGASSLRPRVAARRVSLTLPAPAAPAPAAPRQEVEAVQESGGGSVDVVAESAPRLRNVAPVAGAEAAVRAGRSYAHDHPFQFALAVLVSLLCTLLLVRELRRGSRRALRARATSMPRSELTSTPSKANVSSVRVSERRRVEADVLAERVEVLLPAQQGDAAGAARAWWPAGGRRS